MTHLAPGKNAFLAKNDQRVNSLVKMLDTSQMDLQFQSISENQKTLSFHNFRYSAAVSRNISHQKIKPSNPSSQTHTLKEITGSLPKLHSKSLAHNQLAATLSPTASKDSKIRNIRMPSFNAVNKSIKATHNDQSRYTSLVQATEHTQITHDNTLIEDIRSRLTENFVMTTDQSGDQLNMREDASTGLHSTKKAASFEVKLPLKRRGLNKDMREAYRAVISSKVHGNFSSLAPQEDRESFLKSVQKMKEKTSMSFYRHKDGDQKDANQDEERVMDDINKKGLRDFHRKIALYNFMKGNYLVEPENKEDLRADLGLRKRLVSPLKHPQDLIKDFSTASDRVIQQTQNLSFGVLKVGRDITKSRVNKPKDGLNGNSKATKGSEHNTDSSDDESQRTKALKRIRNPPMLTIAQKTANIEQDLKRMKELGGYIPAKKIFNDEEKLLFRLVKEGNDSDLAYNLGRSAEFVNAMDSRNETLLHWATKRRFYNVVITLCRYGADIDIMDMANRKPIDIAMRIGDNEIIEYLKAQHKKKDANNRYN